MKNGDTAKLIQVPVVGTIVETRWNNEADCKEHCLQSDAGADGIHIRWFKETELESVEGVNNAG